MAGKIQSKLLDLDDWLLLRRGEAAGDEAVVAVERGSTGDDAVIAWNEADDRWEMGTFDTADGASVPTGALSSYVGVKLASVTIGPSVLDSDSLVMGPALSDIATLPFILAAQSAYAQATSNTTGASLILAGGIGRRLSTVGDYTQGALDTLTVTVNGVDTVLTEGTDFDAETSNSVTASNIATAVDAVSGVSAIAVANIVYITPDLGTYTLALATDDQTAWTVTEGTDGQINAIGLSLNPDSLNVGSTTQAVASGDFATGSAASGGLFYDASAKTFASPGTGSNSTNVGIGALASATDSTAYGWGAIASSLESSAFGKNAIASTGTGNLAVGNDSLANGSVQFASAFGSFTDANGQNSSAFGGGAQAQVQNATALGSGSLVSGVEGVAVGPSATATAARALSFGWSADATHVESLVFGSQAVSSAANEVTFGVAGRPFNSLRIISAADTLTFDTTGAGGITYTDAFTITSGTTDDDLTLKTGDNGAGDSGDILLDVGTATGAAGTVTVGGNGIVSAPGPGSLSLRLGSGAIGGAGTKNTTLGDGASTTAGVNNTAVGQGSTASQTTGGCTALGNNASATGQASMALGASSTASAQSAVAIAGTASASSSVSIGVGSTCSGANSISIGASADVTLGNAIAVGWDAQAVATGAIAFGYGTITASTNDTVVGTSASSTVGTGVVVGASATNTGNNATCIGTGASTTGNKATAYGQGATAAANGVAIGGGSTAVAIGTAVGDNSNCAHASAVALGGGSTTTAIQQLVVGSQTSSVIRSVHIGRGVEQATPDADLTFQPTHAAAGGTDKDAQDIIWATGKGTGAGIVSTFSIQTPDVLGTGTTQQSLVTRLVIGEDAITIGSASNEPITIGVSGAAIGLYGTTPTAQASAIADLTDSSGGTANDTIAAVSGSGDDATINDNFADLSAKINALIAVVRGLGAIAT